jgi:serine/threonine protein kinase
MNLRVVDLQGLHQEVQILQSLSSNYIIGLYDVMEDTKYIYLVTELMAGGDLFDRISCKKCYVEEDAWEASQKLLEAIAYCHSKKIVHRDLKPENLLLASKDNDSDIKVGDFGFAKIALSQDCLKTKCGTPTYVAPEILLGKPYGT